MNTVTVNLVSNISLFFYSFGKMMCPVGYNMKQDILSTKKNYIYALDNCKINLGHDVELGVTKIFEREIWALRKVESFKQELMSYQDYSMLEIFRCIDQYAHGYIN